MKRKIMLLIISLVLTAIPTFLFIILMGLVFSFYLQNIGDVVVVWDARMNAILLSSKRVVLEFPVWAIFLGLCVPIFFGSIFLLYKEWQTRKKQKAKELMPYRI